MDANAQSWQWDRQRYESSKAFAAFSSYLDLGPSRSSERVAKEYGKSRALIQRWCTRYHWVERARAYDDRNALIVRSAQEQQLSSDAERWSVARTDYRDHALNVGKRLMERAEQMLQFPLQKTVRSLDADGHTVISVEPVRWKQSDIVSFVATADKMFRLALDLDSAQRSAPASLDSQAPVMRGLFDDLEDTS